jgi:hypothetical protein
VKYWEIIADNLSATMRDDITIAIAILGAGLGVFNLWLNWKRERVSLKVIPRFFFGVAHGGGTPGPAWYWTNERGEKLSKYVCVEIRNKGVSVSVTEVGFLVKVPPAPFRFRNVLRRRSDEKAVISEQFHRFRTDIPFRLEPHSSKTVYADELKPEDFYFVSKYKCAYAVVASGKRFTGKSRMIKELWKYRELVNNLNAAS